MSEDGAAAQRDDECTCARCTCMLMNARDMQPQNCGNTILRHVNRRSSGSATQFRSPQTSTTAKASSRASPQSTTVVEMESGLSISLNEHPMGCCKTVQITDVRGKMRTGRDVPSVYRAQRMIEMELREACVISMAMKRCTMQFEHFAVSLEAQAAQCCDVRRRKKVALVVQNRHQTMEPGKWGRANGASRPRGRFSLH